jgi:hypothetical protein
MLILFLHYLLPSGCISNLKHPNFQSCAVPVFAIFNETNLALARVSTLVVVESIVKGPKGELALYYLDNLLNLKYLSITCLR